MFAKGVLCGSQLLPLAVKCLLLVSLQLLSDDGTFLSLLPLELLDSRNFLQLQVLLPRGLHLCDLVPELLHRETLLTDESPCVFCLGLLQLSAFFLQLLIRDKSCRQ